MLRLQVAVDGDVWVFGFPLEGNAKLRIGADATSHIVLAHETVARQHATLGRVGRSIQVMSIDGGRPTVVNNAAISRSDGAFVMAGDLIEIGPYQLEILEHDPSGEVEDEFLASIASDPQDDGMRAVYGDWLEENGRADAATFLRAQIELRGIPIADPRFESLSKTLERLAPMMAVSWRRAVARPAVENCDVRFELKCPKQWDQLAPTSRPNVRHCSACDKPVFYASSIDAAKRLAIMGSCVAVDITVGRKPRDLAPSPPPVMLGRITR